MFQDATLFSATFPLPFRVLSLVGLGIFSWATNLHGLQALGINASSALHLNSHFNRSQYAERFLPGARHPRFSEPPAPYVPVYKLLFQYSFLTLIAWLLYCHATQGKLELVDVYRFIPAVICLLLFMFLISPFKVFERFERDAFLSAISRCLFSPRIYFADVVFADVFTSFAKVIGDVWLSASMLLPGGSLLVPPAQEGWLRWVLPTLMSLPYAVRFRQCLVEYLSPTNENKKPLYNAIKYASSFPVIYLSAAQRIVVTDLLSSPGQEVEKESWHTDWLLFRLWLLAALVNSLYSFWWDVTHDWGFDLLLPRRSHSSSEPRPRTPPKQLVLPHLHSRMSLLSSPIEDEEKSRSPLEGAQVLTIPGRRHQYPFGLRPTLLLPLPIYPFVIVADLFLRLTWSAKLSSHLHSIVSGDLVIFWIEMAEVVRRWMWVFLRVEWEVIKQQEGHYSGSPRTPYYDEMGTASAVTSQFGLHRREGSGEEYEMVNSDRGGGGSEVG